MNDQELQYVLSLVPDTSAIDDALQSMAIKASQAARQAGAQTLRAPGVPGGVGTAGVGGVPAYGQVYQTAGAPVTGGLGAPGGPGSAGGTPYQPFTTTTGTQGPGGQPTPDMAYLQERLRTDQELIKLVNAHQTIQGAVTGYGGVQQAGAGMPAPAPPTPPASTPPAPGTTAVVGTLGGGGVVAAVSQQLTLLANAMKQVGTAASLAAGMIATGNISGLLNSVGGASSAAMQLVGNLASAVPAGLGALAGKVVDGLDYLAGGINRLGSSTGQVNMLVDMVGKGMSVLAAGLSKIPGVGDVLGPMMEQLGRLPEVLKGVTGTLVGFAAKASPGQFRMFEMAVEDVQGVIGQTFLPVLELLRDGIRLFGDVLASILPSSGEAREGLAGVYEAFTTFKDALSEVMKEIGPLIRTVFIGALKALGVVFKVLAEAVSLAMKALTPIIKFFNWLFGIKADDQMRSSVGAAARQVSIGQTGQYLQQLQLAAYREPGVRTDDVKSNVKDIAGGVQKIADWTELLTPSGMGKAVVDAINPFADKWSNQKDPNGTGAAVNEDTYGSRFRNWLKYWTFSVT